MRFNGRRRRRLGRGQVVLVPLSDLVLSPQGRQAITDATGEPVSEGELRERQTRIGEQPPTLREHVRRGHYPEALALGNRLLGAGDLTGNQVVTIQRELAVAFVALDRTDLALEAFERALERQPDLELDSRLTSPTVLDVFTQARRRLAERATRATAPTDGDASVPASDAGVPPQP
jgi:tetratricopeptide (TPR) repeat protein